MLIVVRIGCWFPIAEGSQGLCLLLCLPHASFTACGSQPNLRVHGCAQKELSGGYLFLHIPMALILSCIQVLLQKDRGILQIWMVSHHSQLRALEHIRYRFALLIAVRDVPKGTGIRVIVCPMLQRSLLLPGSQHGATWCNALFNQDAESCVSKTACQRVFRKCLYRTQV